MKTEIMFFSGVPLIWDGKLEVKPQPSGDFVELKNGENLVAFIAIRDIRVIRFIESETKQEKV